jgi:hypothetical protein
MLKSQEFIQVGKESWRCVQMKTVRDRHIINGISSSKVQVVFKYVPKLLYLKGANCSRLSIKTAAEGGSYSHFFHSSDLILFLSSLLHQFLAAIAALYRTMAVRRLVCQSVTNEFQS